MTRNHISQDATLRAVVELAKEKLRVNRVILFGSRARDLNAETADYDLAFDYPPSRKAEWSRFVLEVEDQVETLKNIDCIDLSECSKDLLKKIKQEGVVVYDGHGGSRAEN